MRLLKTTLKLIFIISSIDNNDNFFIGRRFTQMDSDGFWGQKLGFKGFAWGQACFIVVVWGLSMGSNFQLSENSLMS